MFKFDDSTPEGELKMELSCLGLKEIPEGVTRGQIADAYFDEEWKKGKTYKTAKDFKKYKSLY